MEFRKTNASTTTVSRDLSTIAEEVGNVYETVMIIAKRANQINSELKSEIDKKLQDFAGSTDSIEEVYENREQIEVSRYFERLPKPTLYATQEFIEGKIYYRNPLKDQTKLI